MTFQLLEGDDDAECADAGEEWNFSKTRCRQELGRGQEALGGMSSAVTT